MKPLSHYLYQQMSVSVLRKSIYFLIFSLLVYKKNKWFLGTSRLTKTRMPVAKSETTPMKSKILNIGISLKKLRYNVDEFGKNTFMTAKAEIFIRVRKKKPNQ